MKKIIIAISALFLTASCTQEKTGYVDISELVKEYQEMKDTQEAFEVKTTAFNTKRDSISRAYQLEEQSFRLKAQKMAQSKAQEEYQVLQQKAQILGQQLQTEQQQLQQEGQSQIDELLTKVKDFISDYGSKNQYTYILGKNEAGSILYGKEDKNLTDIILKELNTTYKK